MAKILRLTSEDRENLVAYLDGELDESVTQRLDQILATSEVARHDVESLARTWEILDILAKPGASADFTQKTVATAKLEEQPSRLSDQPWFAYVRRAAVAGVWIGCLLMAAVTGYAITNLGVRNPHEELLRELPLIENLDTYMEAEDVSFVKELKRSMLFEEGSDDR